MKRKKKIFLKEKRSGVCKLTHEQGIFIESHLIPKALTKPSQKGMSLVQFGVSVRPVRRWSSWFDPELVTQAGENILTELDTWAISELRKHKLIWGGWGVNQTLGSLHNPISDTSWGIRKVEGINPKKLRLFFLSLLWRAAATSLPEFAEVQLPKQDLEQLRLMLCSKTPEPISFYPATLIQLSTIGHIHNHVPIFSKKRIPSLVHTDSAWDLPIYRFYFDGLITHIHCHALDKGYTSSLGAWIVGADDQLLVHTQTYKGSFQEANLNALLSGTLRV
jgi:hypothetical protein